MGGIHYCFWNAFLKRRFYMENLLIVKQLLETILSTPVIVTDDLPGSLKSFEDEHCFSKTLQPINTASYLHEFTDEMDRNTIYEIYEPLETVKILFFLGNYLVIIGPYTETEWDTKKSERLLAVLGISMSYLTSYELYKCHYSIINFELIMRAVKTLIEAGGFCVSDYSYRKIKKTFDGDVSSAPISKEYTYEYVNRRYALENEFMHFIQTGDALKAKETLKKLTLMTQGLSYTKGIMWNNIAGASCLRTIIRIAATQSALPPIIIDAITQKYAQNLYSIGNFAHKHQSSNFAYELVDELCTEIEKIQKQKYSAIVRKAISFIQLNLGHTLSVNLIAAELHITADYLAKQFKKETDTLIRNYIMMERTKKAAELLLSTRLTIQDISTYVGYVDNNYFVKVFKCHYGMTPTDYRKKYAI